MFQIRDRITRSKHVIPLLINPCVKGICNTLSLLNKLIIIDSIIALLTCINHKGPHLKK